MAHKNRGHVKKSLILGISFGTARARLERDLLFKLATEAGHICFRCSGELTRENFSVDHKITWMSSESPRDAFFDLNNIAFSHQHCNQMEMISRRKAYVNNAARCAAYFKRRSQRMPQEEKQKRRRERYEKYGC